MTHLANPAPPAATPTPSSDPSSKAAPCFLAPTVSLKSNSNIREFCDFVIFHRPQPADPPMAIVPYSIDAFIDRMGELREGALVHVGTGLLKEFFGRAFPLIRKPFVLVTGSSDWSAPGGYRYALENPKLIRWFTENPDLTIEHPKFEAIPIGFGNKGVAHGDHDALLRLHPRMPPVAEKPLVAHASFHLNISNAERRAVREAIRTLDGVDLQPERVPTQLLWIRYANHAFEISPAGSGPDCHRTWEALLLSTIPIVKSSTLDPLYRRFPVVIVDDWREITPAAMASWRDRFKDSFTLEMFTRLTREYWVKRIRNAATGVLEGGRAEEPLPR